MILKKNWSGCDILNKFNKLKSGIKKVKFGKHCQFVDPVNLYGCKLGNSIFVGPFVEIQKNVTIGNNTRIQSHSFICEKVIIGSNCFISHGVTFVNDLVKKGKINRTSKSFKKTLYFWNLKPNFKLIWK